MSAPKTTTLTSEDVMYLNCFKRAYHDPEGQFVIECQSAREAHRVKIALYRTKKKLLNNFELREQFHDMVRVCSDTSIAIKTEPHAMVTLYRTDSSDFNRRLMARLGMSPGDNKPLIPQDAEESVKRFMRKMEEEETVEKETGGKKENPYFDLSKD